MSSTSRQTQPPATLPGRRVLVADRDFLGAAPVEEMPVEEMLSEPAGALEAALVRGDQA